jgi:hypothetical protein
MYICNPKRNHIWFVITRRETDDVREEEAVAHTQRYGIRGAIGESGDGQVRGIYSVLLEHLCQASAHHEW